ncbi:hypothetical protein L2E82_13965 [Cichorium intybus]|uniref:Uncharacterized protein n=1 Tax=Cichorium intybus TaxID=13427 RepID=A0ACB9EYN3_CICIN|nr:hypothetical protein L2E82_13965 [Cichorium intybus]
MSMKGRTKGLREGRSELIRMETWRRGKRDIFEPEHISNLLSGLKDEFVNEKFKFKDQRTQFENRSGTDSNANCPEAEEEGKNLKTSNVCSLNMIDARL